MNSPEQANPDKHEISGCQRLQREWEIQGVDFFLGAFCPNKNVLELDAVMALQLCDYTKSP